MIYLLLKKLSLAVGEQKSAALVVRALRLSPHSLSHLNDDDGIFNSRSAKNSLIAMAISALRVHGEVY